MSYWKNSVKVYVVAHAADGGHAGPVKVGISANPGARLSEIQTANPRPLCLSFAFEMPNREMARYIEAWFHRTQKDARLVGEWFDVDPVAAIRCLCVIISYAVLEDCAGTTVTQGQIDELLTIVGVRKAESLYVHREPPKATAAASGAIN